MIAVDVSRRALFVALTGLYDAGSLQHFGGRMLHFPPGAGEHTC
jgi:hypothetical protein